MFGIEKLLEKILHRQNLPKEKRGEFEIDLKTKYIHGLLFYNSYFDYVYKSLPKEAICFIVGGWIRDRLLNRSIRKKIDIDFLVTTDPTEIVNNLRKILGRGEVFSFDKETEVATIVFSEGDIRYRFDFSYLDIKDILEDITLDFYEKEKEIIKRIEKNLLERDFTINAMAVVFDDTVGLGASQTVLFDPSNGLEDLQSGIVRPVSYKNIEKDPVRILRGYRIAQELDFDIEKEFEKWVKSNKSSIKNSPKERVRDEILKIFENSRTAEILEKLIRDGVVQEIIPEIEEMVKIKKIGDFHRYNLLDHSLKTVEYIEEFLKKKRF
ncbi:CCA tRNA nucleotidyltransferase [Persephonella sp.]